MDRGAWEATIHGPQRVGPKLKKKTKPKQTNNNNNNKQFHLPLHQKEYDI